MKINESRRNAAGFSLMELVVVVAIIVLLAGLTMAGMSFINQKNAREKAKVQVKLIENSLENYFNDNRSYPPANDPAGERGDEVLYKYLYYDGFEARDNGGVVYLPELDPDNNTKSGQAWMEGKGQQARIIDPWGKYFRYRSGDTPDAVNPDFDIWSCGPDGKTNADPKHKDCLDDIKNW
ncbi:type II secretion system protein GspG [Luteolibacter luteus]|uniref:Prepilin-type N-terminal cleavage/methylation domain-containing protein n=1 Tax=Luteolibacter luteus TaxID=2728835 RepID=A0A858RSC5_9BACT|nr:type II secretion system protein GspG [Luteolibacter luteus]QJE99358.1 prepilin-type N-terminal cleavage/methylation domain-containing protein [Luteolibacter luteus]